MKCVKSVLGEFSSGVSICRNKGTQSDLGALFLPGAPPAGGMGSLPPALCTLYLKMPVHTHLKLSGVYPEQNQISSIAMGSVKG